LSTIRVKKIAVYLSLLTAATVQAEPKVYSDRTIEREGVRVRLRIEALDAKAPANLLMGQSVRLRLSGTRLADGQALSNWNPGVWLDRETDPLSGAVPVCGQRVARFLSGSILQRPLLDLTGYYVMTMDAEPSVSILDPAVSFSGRSSLYAAMKLQGSGFDWVKTSDDLRGFVALPAQKKVAILDLQSLKTIDHIPLLGRPSRLALHPGERLLWIGQTGETEKESAVDILDTVSGKLVSHIPLPEGHHEFAFSHDGRYAYVTSRQAGMMTIIDAIKLTKLQDIAVGPQPLTTVFVPEAASVWVIEAQEGRIHRYDQEGSALDVLTIEPGLGPSKLTPDGKHVLVLNPSQHRLYVLDAASGKEQHRLTISGQPYDMIFSEQYVYVRTLATEQIAMLSLASLQSKSAFIKYVTAGESPLAAMANLPRSSSMTTTLDGNGAFFATPGEKTLYHYMEGMNAPDSGLRTYGHTAMSAMVIRRGFRETSTGEYTAIVKLPSAGRLVMALASQTPQFSECMGIKVNASEEKDPNQGIAMVWMDEHSQTLKSGQNFSIRVGLRDKNQHYLLAGSSLQLRIVSARGGKVTLVPMREDKKGEWLASGSLDEAGGYYVYLDSERKINSIFTTLYVTDKSSKPREMP
jgi:DNA-binding beta-propeller fold protein YncE